MMTNPLLKRDYSRLDQFLKDRENDIGPMTWMTKTDNSLPQLNRQAADKAIKTLVEKFNLKAGNTVLDIGCGLGETTAEFHSLGCDVIGTTIKIEEGLQKTIDKTGIDVVECDQSFMPCVAESNDFIFARHVLEHSIFPFFTLSEYNRVLKTGGILYVELPVLNGYFNHEQNPNHYAVMGTKMWEELFRRSGFALLLAEDFAFSGVLAEGEQVMRHLDTWHSYYLRKDHDKVRIVWE